MRSEKFLLETYRLNTRKAQAKGTARERRPSWRLQAVISSPNDFDQRVTSERSNKRGVASLYGLRTRDGHRMVGAS